jgi:hypothetical protein
MKTRECIAAGVVFCATLAAGMPGWAQERTTAEEERRAPVVLRPNEKAAMLGDMRQYLTGLQIMFAALAKDDMDAVAEQAKALGKIKIFDTYLRFPTASGAMFRGLSTQVHEDFEEIAQDAKTNRNTKATLGKLATTMKRCISCHESFRLAESSHSR